MSFKLNLVLVSFLIPLSVSAETLQEKFDAFQNRSKISQPDLQEVISKEREALGKKYRSAGTQLLLKTAIEKQIAYLSKLGFQIVSIDSRPSTETLTHGGGGRFLIWGSIAKIENGLRLCSLRGSFYEASSVDTVVLNININFQGLTCANSDGSITDVETHFRPGGSLAYSIDITNGGKYVLVVSIPDKNNVGMSSSGESISGILND